MQPKRFVQRLKRDNELFRGHMHQDAHEFLNFLLNEASDVLEKERREAARRSGALPPGSIDGGSQYAGGGQQQQQGNASAPPVPPKTWVQDLFQGRWVNETRCLRCETVTSREETWLEWSLEIEPNSSVTGCLRNFRCVREARGRPGWRAHVLCWGRVCETSLLVLPSANGLGGVFLCHARCMHLSLSHHRRHHKRVHAARPRHWTRRTSSPATRAAACRRPRSTSSVASCRA